MRRVVLWCAVAAMALASGCKDENNPIDGDSPSNIIFPISGVSYAVHVQPLFNQTCALTGCHGDGSQSSILRLTNYDNLMYGGALVIVRNQPDQSTLVMRIEGRIGERMPLNRRALNQNQINGIRAWIGEGALNN
ncbi:MAG: hypothetical protein IPI01_07200 [Ignavibacteriae bacterium]|nr:hypothetical protein [Ignavibacteriota bacterium]